jgi:hypothetical protein
MLHTPLTMRPAADKKVTVDFVMDDRATSGIKICRTPDIITIKTKLLTEKESDLASFILKVYDFNFSNVNI